MAAPIQPFEISTTGDLRARLLAQMPPQTRLERQHVADLAADPRGWSAIDAPYYRPGEAAGRVGSSFDTTAPVRVFVELLVPPTGRIIVASVEVRTSEEPPTDKRPLGDGVAIDFGQLMIARTDALERRWKVGGARCGANLLHASDFLGKKRATPRHLAAAVKALEATGVQLEQRAPMQQWHLVGPVSDAQLELARETLKSLGPHVTLNVNQPHTGAQVRDALAKAVVAPLSEGGETFGVVLRPGFGNGLYAWDELLAGPTTVGHRMEFISPQTEEAR